jgi:hypothetical protein
MNHACKLLAALAVAALAHGRTYESVKAEAEQNWMTYSGS